MISPELLDAFKWHRQQFFARHCQQFFARFPFKPVFGVAARPAQSALAKARDDVAKGKRRYPSSSIHNVSRQSGPNYGPNYAWIEDPAAIGLRFVGHADELVRSISHQGWYTDDDFQDETLRGAVWQFPARKGLPIYVAGYSDPINKGAAFVCLDLIEGNRGERAGDFYSAHGARDAAMQADSIAENAAEREREWRAASSARMQFEELADEIASVRKDLLAVLGERRRAAVLNPEGFPALCATIRTAVRRGLQDIEDARKKRYELSDAYSRQEGWKDA